MARRVTLAQLEDDVSRFRDERDWKQFHNPKDLAVSISIEAAELLELFQWKSADDVDSCLRDPVWREADNAQGRLGWLQRLKDEVADVVIYCLSMSSAVGFDLAGAVQDKLQQNAEKYPADKVRGSAKKYTELLKKEER